MAFGILPLLLLSVTCGTVAVYQEEMNFFTWTFFTCKFRRHYDRRVCCSDLHCPPEACCQLDMAMGGLSFLGKCVPRDPHTWLCTRRRQCYKQKDCGPGSCCRQVQGGKKGGLCERQGQEGDECMTSSRSGYRYRYTLCPCADGLTCQTSTAKAKGCCSASTITSTPPPPPPTTASPTAAPATTTEEDCGCPDLNLFCCVGSSCRTRPVGGEACDPINDCPCVLPSVCSNQGVCV